jgi:hypothetical protein
MLSVAGSMAVISSVVLGADAGVVAYGLSASLLAALLAGATAGTVLMFATARYQWARWCVASSAPARTSTLPDSPGTRGSAGAGATSVPGLPTFPSRPPGPHRNHSKGA